MKYITSLLAVLLLDGALAVPLRKRDSLPFGLLTVQSDDPALDNRIVSAMSVDGTLWINAGSRAFLGIVRSNSTLQEFGTTEFLSVDVASSQLTIGNAEDGRFTIDGEKLHVDGESEVIACQQFKHAYQLFKKRANFTCVDEAGQPAKSVGVGLKTLALARSSDDSEPYPPPLDAEGNGDEDSDGHSGYFPPGVYPLSDDDYTFDNDTDVGNSTHQRVQRRDLDVIIPLPYNVNLTVTMTPGQTAISAGFLIPAAAGTGKMHQTNAASTASRAMVTSVAAAETAPVRQPAWPTVTLVPVVENDEKSGQPNGMPIAVIGPSYFIGDGDDQVPVMVKSPTMGKVEAYGSEYRAMTYASFDIPKDVSYKSCGIVFENDNPSFAPVTAGDKSFEVWTLDSSIPQDMSAINMPNLKEKVAIFTDNKIEYTGSKLLCTPNQPVQVAFVPTATTTNSSVVWFQQYGAGFKLALDN